MAVGSDSNMQTAKQEIMLVPIFAALCRPRLVREDYARWGMVIKAAGIKAK